MSDDPKRAAKIRQQRRLGAALRENLKRRKAQAQSRVAPSPASATRSHDSAGIGGKTGPER